MAAILNERGFRSSVDGLPFTTNMIAALQRSHNLKSRYERLREKGLLNVVEVAERLNICPSTVGSWHKKGLLKRHPYVKNKYLFEPPPDRDYEKGKPFELRTFLENDSQQLNEEVQYE